MRLAAVRWIADLLKDPETGVNAVASSIPKLDDWPDVPTLQVYDESRHGWIRGAAVPKAIYNETPYPLIVRRHMVAEGDVLPAGNGYDAVSTAIHFLAKDDVDASAAQTAIIAEQALLVVRRILSLNIPDFVQTTYPSLAGAEFRQSETNAFSNHVSPAPLEGGVTIDTLIVRLAVHHQWALGINPAVSS